MSFTIGCDPEVFVKKVGEPGFVSAHGLIPGDKKAPHKVANGAVQVDGMAVEFNTDPVQLSAYGSETFSNQVLSVFSSLSKMIKEKDATFTLARNAATADFDPEYLEAQPEEAKELGCDPDYNAYTGEMNERPDGSVNFRTAAGHIHIGWGADIPVDHPEHLEICRNIVKVLDLFVGIPSVILDRDSRRRLMYGKAGAFRPKPYGVEYRTPSNFWIFNQDNRKEIFNAVRHATGALKAYGGDVNAVFSAYARGNVKRYTSEEVRQIIDEDDFEKALDIGRNFYWMPVWSQVFHNLSRAKPN